MVVRVRNYKKKLTKGLQLAKKAWFQVSFAKKMTERNQSSLCKELESLLMQMKN